MSAHPQRSEYFGLYINLDRAVERRAAVERQLVSLGLTHRYTRLPAVDGRNSGFLDDRAVSPAELGCWMSHRKAWQVCIDRGIPCHVMEDDVVLSRAIELRIQAILSSTPLERWDIIFTDMSFSELDELLRVVRDVRLQRTKGKFAILPMERTSLAAAASYLIHPQSAARLLEIIEPDKCDNPVDLLMRHFINQGKFTAFITTPFLTTISDFANDSQISPDSAMPDDVRRAHRAVVALRRSLFIEADPAASIAEMTKISEPAQCFEGIMLAHLTKCLVMATRGSRSK